MTGTSNDKFDPSVAAKEASAEIKDRIFAAGGNVVAAITTLINEGAHTAVKLAHVTLIDDTVAEIIATGSTTSGRDKLLTKQPLAIGSSAQPTPPTEEETVARTLAEAIANVPSDKRASRGALVQRAIDGKLDNIDLDKTDRQRELSAVQQKLDDSTANAGRLQSRISTLEQQLTQSTRPKPGPPASAPAPSPDDAKAKCLDEIAKKAKPARLREGVFNFDVAQLSSESQDTWNGLSSNK